MIDYRTMMGEGEDTEEFFVRLVQIARDKDAISAIVLTNNFNAMRHACLRGAVTQEERDTHLDEQIRELLEITGPVEPSEEYVGYF